MDFCCKGNATSAVGLRHTLPLSFSVLVQLRCLFCSTAVERLRNVDDAFRKQLDAKEESHQVALQQLAQEKQAEVDLANKRVCTGMTGHLTV